MAHRSIKTRIEDRLRLYYRRYVMRDFFCPSPETPKAVVRSLKMTKRLPGDYYEFGVYKGFCFYKAVRTSPAIHHFAFDSFEGLPSTDEGGRFQGGQYACSLEKVKENLQRRVHITEKEHFYKGFYDETLTKELQEELQGHKARVVLIDVDLYKSTVPVLRFIRPMLQRGTIVLFDDWNCFDAADDKGERRAFNEFIAENPGIIFEELFSFGWHGQAFRVVSL